MDDYDNVHVCKNCGAVYTYEPTAYISTPGDHFGGTKIVVPRCHMCNTGRFFMRTKHDHELILELRKRPTKEEIIKSFTEMLDSYTPMYTFIKSNKRPAMSKLSVYTKKRILLILNKVLSQFE